MEVHKSKINSQKEMNPAETGGSSADIENKFIKELENIAIDDP
jgi:hypothetical protein